MNTDSIKKIAFVKNVTDYYNVGFDKYYPKNVHAFSLPPSYLMAAAIDRLELNRELINRAVEIQNALGVGTTIWGMRSENNVFSLEFYFYYNKLIQKHSFENLLSLLNPYMETPFINEHPGEGYCLISYNLDTEKIEGLNVYYVRLDQNRPIIEVEDTGWSYNQDTYVCKSYFFTPKKPKIEEVNINYVYLNCIRDLYSILECIYSCCRELFPTEDPIVANSLLALPYLYDQDRNRYIHPYCITRKKSAVGVYFRLSLNQYIHLLKYHRYPNAYISAVETEKENLNHLQIDVVIDFYIQNGEFKIKKTANFGSF